VTESAGVAWAISVATRLDRRCAFGFAASSATDSCALVMGCVRRSASPCSVGGLAELRDHGSESLHLSDERGHVLSGGGDEVTIGSAQVRLGAADPVSVAPVPGEHDDEVVVAGRGARGRCLSAALDGQQDGVGHGFLLRRSFDRRSCGRVTR
jgi:hypothetical protein